MKYYHHLMAFLREHPRLPLGTLPNRLPHNAGMVELAKQDSFRFYAQEAANHLRDSMKFQSLDDETLRQYIPQQQVFEGMVHLPYSPLFVEIPVGISDGIDTDTMIGTATMGVLAIGKQVGHEIGILALYFIGDEEDPPMAPTGCVSYIQSGGDGITADHCLQVPADQPELQEPLHASVNIWAANFIRFLKMLERPAAKIEVFRPTAKQQQRALKQKRKLVAYKTLTIDPDKVRVVNLYKGDKGRHSSPCLHIRRATTRHYKSGKTARVPAMLVGSAARGISLTEYVMQVKAGQMPATQATWDYIYEQEPDLRISQAADQGGNAGDTQFAHY